MKQVTCFIMGNCHVPQTYFELEKNFQELLPDKTHTYTCMRLVGFIVSVIWRYLQLFCEINHNIADSLNLTTMKYI